MKKILLLLTIASITITSCQGKYTIAKRKYNKGFYVSSSNGKDVKGESFKMATEVAKIKTSDLVEQEIVSAAVKPVQLLVAPSSIVPNTFSQKPNIVAKTNKGVAPVVASNTNEYNQQTATVKPLLIKEKIASKKGSDSDLIVQIILALFPILCLIAVFLHDGKSITLNFWIDLLLHITLIGEIIFAILVVLDVVNLA